MSEIGMGFEFIYFMIFIVLYMCVYFMKIYLKFFFDGFKLWYKWRRKILWFLKMQVERGKKWQFYNKIIID